MQLHLPKSIPCAVPVALIASLCFVTVAASAQVNGFPQLGHIGPSKGEVIGAAIGAGAVIALVVYLSVPKQATIEGCVETADGVSRLTDARDHRQYELVGSDVALKAGKQLRLKGKKHKTKTGRQLLVKKLVEDKGGCQPGAPAHSP